MVPNGRLVSRAAAVTLAVVGAALAIAVSTGAGATSAPTPALTPVMLPGDHGSHPGFGIEWWYSAAG